MPTVNQILTWQSSLFASRLKRLPMLKLQADWELLPITIRVHRNHSFELLTQPVGVFLAYAGFEARWLMSDYDDTLSFNLDQGPVDIELIWMDFARYEKSQSVLELLDWITKRIQTLRKKSNAIIIVANWVGGGNKGKLFNEGLSRYCGSESAVEVIDIVPIEEQLRESIFNDRLLAITGTRMSDESCLEISRILGSRIIPGLLGRNIKVIAVDLDNTLYQGVLGEDGIENLILTEAHKKLQECLVELQRKGLLLVCLSRNNLEDVEHLFLKRSDFPLRLEHFSDWQVSWDHKAVGLRKAVNKLRVATNTVLYIDDNPGELSSVSIEIPDVRIIYSPNTEQTICALRYFPCLWPLRFNKTDQLRTADVRANIEREILSRELSNPVNYVRELCVSLCFSMNPSEERDRLYELSRKTNQFNLSLKRFDMIDIEKYLNSKEHRVVSIGLVDKLADSGIIAALFARLEKDILYVDELCISCRAMGRYLEDVIITESLIGILHQLSATMVAFHIEIGPRNMPALKWFSGYTGKKLEELKKGEYSIVWDSERMLSLLKQWPVIKKWRGL